MLTMQRAINCLFLKRREFCSNTYTTIHICVHVESFTFETYAESDEELSPLVSCGKGLLAQKWFRWLRKSCADILLGNNNTFAYRKYEFVKLQKSEASSSILSECVGSRMMWVIADGKRGSHSYEGQESFVLPLFFFLQTFQIWDCRDFKWDVMLKANYGIKDHAIA